MDEDSTSSVPDFHFPRSVFIWTRTSTLGLSSSVCMARTISERSSAAPLCALNMCCEPFKSAGFFEPRLPPDSSVLSLLRASTDARYSHAFLAHLQLALRCLSGCCIAHPAPRYVRHSRSRPERARDCFRKSRRLPLVRMISLEPLHFLTIFPPVLFSKTSSLGGIDSTTIPYLPSPLPYA